MTEKLSTFTVLKLLMGNVGRTTTEEAKTYDLFRLPGRTDFCQVEWPGWPWCNAAIEQTWERGAEEDADGARRHRRHFVQIAFEHRNDGRPHWTHVRAAYRHVTPHPVIHRGITWPARVRCPRTAAIVYSANHLTVPSTLLRNYYYDCIYTESQKTSHFGKRKPIRQRTGALTYHVRPHQPIIDQQGLGLRGLVHKEAHPVIPDLH